MSNLAHKAECEIKGVQVSELNTYWPFAKPLLQKALDQGSDYSINEIYDGLLDRSMQLWCHEKAALVTAIQSDRRNTFCLLLALGGEALSVWFQHLPLLEDWAKDQGAKEMRIYGRRAWLRLTNYEEKWTMMSKEL